jgi:hypothetical protein
MAMVLPLLPRTGVYIVVVYSLTKYLKQWQQWQQL